MSTNPHIEGDSQLQHSLGGAGTLAGNKIVIAYNPTAGASDRKHQVAALSQRLLAEGFETRVCPEPEELVAVAGEYLSTGELRGVVTAGGDGTVAMAVNRLPVGIPLAIFPLGTENLLSRYLEHTAELDSLVRLFQTGRVIRLDAATANDRLFCLMTGIGFDAEVVHRTHAARRGNISYANYIKPILATLRSYPYPELRVTLFQAEKMTESFACRWAFITNIPRYAGGLRFSPQAKPHDGLLDVCLFQRGWLWPGITYLFGVITGSHGRWRETTMRQGVVIRVESQEPVPYQLDGDPGGMLPLEIRCLPGRLSFLASNLWIERHRFPVSEG